MTKILSKDKWQKKYNKILINQFLAGYDDQLCNFMDYQYDQYRLKMASLKPKKCPKCKSILEPIQMEVAGGISIGHQCNNKDCGYTIEEY